MKYSVANTAAGSKWLRLRMKVGVILATLGLSACSLLDFDFQRASEPKTAEKPQRVAEPSGLKEVANPGELERYLQQLVRSSAAPLNEGNVGYYMDVQFATLQQKLRESGIEITRGNREIHMLVPGAPTFTTGSDKIKDEATSALSMIGKILTEYDKTLVAVVGHSDASGGAKANHALARRRAMAVGQYLHNESVASQRLVIMSFGSEKPIASNDTAEGRAQNRRVELILKPIAVLAAK